MCENCYDYSNITNFYFKNLLRLLAAETAESFVFSGLANNERRSCVVCLSESGDLLGHHAKRGNISPPPDASNGGDRDQQADTGHLNQPLAGSILVRQCLDVIRHLTDAVIEAASIGGQRLNDADHARASHKHFADDQLRNILYKFKSDRHFDLSQRAHK